MMTRGSKRNSRCLRCSLVAVLITSRVLLVSSAQGFFNLRRPAPRELQQHTTREYSVLLHLSLQYVNDTFAAQFLASRSDAASQQTDTVRHFCNSVNHQAGGNQAELAAAENGARIRTEIRGTIEKPDYQCEIVDAGRIPDAAPPSTGSSTLYAFGVTVEQVVYVTANRTLDLASVTSIAQSGFNRGKGGRVRFRSLLQDNPMFATVANVEVRDGALTRRPTPQPTAQPSETPSLVPSSRPTLRPTPTKVLTETTAPPSSSPPTQSTVSIPVKLTPPLTQPPTEYPSNDEKPTVLPVSSRKDPDSMDRALDAELVVAITAVSLIGIACLCLLCVFNHHRKDNYNNTGNSSSHSRRRLPINDQEDEEMNVGQVPNMVQLDGDNQSLANTTLGDQTAGRTHSRRKKSHITRHEGEGSESGQGMEVSYHSNSLNGSQEQISMTPAAVIPTDASKEGGDSHNASATSNDSMLPPSVMGLDSQNASSTSNTSMLPPSVMPYEEESLMFPVEDADSESTSTGSGEIESSLLSESFTSSSAVESDAQLGPVDVDALEMPAQQRRSADVDDLEIALDIKQNNFTRFPFADPTLGLKTEHVNEGGSKKGGPERKEDDTRQRKKDFQGRDDASDETPRFSPFEPNETLTAVKFDFDKHSKLNSSFRSLEDDAAPSAASSTSSLTKKAENLFFFGFQPPPEDQKTQDSPGHDEEEKREIEFETRDDKQDDDDLLDTLTGNGLEGGLTPLPLDLLADHQLLERSPSPASWESWKMPQDQPPTHRESRYFASKIDESKSAPAEDLNPSSVPKIPYQNQSLPLGASKSTLSTPGFRHFLPFPKEGETKEASPGTRPKTVSDEDGKGVSPSISEKGTLSAALLGLKDIKPEESGAGILGVQPRKEADALDARSGSSSSTGQNNPWLFEAVEQTLGPRSVTADLESLSGRSNRSSKSHRSNRSRQSHRSHKSNRSYNVPPSNKYKGRGDGRIRSAAASVASYGGSSFDRKSGETNKTSTDLTRLEMQLAALRNETDQVTASSITLSSVGAKTRSTRSSKLTHTGAKIIRKRRVIVEVPPGKLGVVLANRHDGKGTVVSEVRAGSSLKGMLSPGDKLVAIDGEDVQGRSVNDITEIMTKKHNMERLLTVITSMHQETKSAKSVGTL